MSIVGLVSFIQSISFQAALALVAADKPDDLKSLTHQPKEAYDLYKAEVRSRVLYRRPVAHAIG